MRKIALLAAAAAFAAVPAAQASKPANPGSQGKSQSKSKRCKNAVAKRAYNVGGVLTANPTVTQTAGQGTETKKDDRYTVEAAFTVTSSNKAARSDYPKGSAKTLTVTNVRVSFFDRNNDGTVDAPQAGDQVKFHGKKSFKAKKKCTVDSSLLNVVTWQKVGFSAPETTTTTTS